MTIKITPREWEAISAYLDGQLAQKERAHLEARLQSSAELRSAMEDLRTTRTLLRSQPKVRAPRNFTLTPQMVGGYASRRPAPALSLFSFMRLGSAFAGLVLVMVLVADLFAGAPPVPTASMPQMEAVAMATEEAFLEASPIMKTPPDAGVQSAPGEAPLAAPGEAPSIAASEAMTESMTMMEAPAQAPAEAAEPAAEESAAEDAAVEAFGGEETISPELQGTLPAPAGAAPPLAQAEPAESQPFLEDAARSAGGEADQAEQETALDVPVSGTEQASRFPPLDRQTLRWMEVVLGALALGLGAAAYLLRRSGGGA
jgi:hypothetical protein